MDIIKSIIAFLMSNWEMITGGLVPLAGLVYGTIKAKDKWKRVKADASEWKKIGVMGLKALEVQLAQDPENISHAKRNQLIEVQEKLGVQGKVNTALDEIREERKKKVADGSLGLSIETDVDIRSGNIKPSFGLSLNKLF